MSRRCVADLRKSVVTFTLALMPKEVRVILSLCAAVIAFVLTLGLEISILGSDGLKGLLMMSIVGLAVAGAGVGVAAAVGGAAGFFVYGATWFVQEAFELHPRVASTTDQPPRHQMGRTLAQQKGVDLALLRAELELSTGKNIEATCPICSGQLSVDRTSTPKSAVILCPCTACRRELVAHSR